MKELFKKELRELLTKQMLITLIAIALVTVLCGVAMTQSISEDILDSNEIHLIDMDQSTLSHQLSTLLSEENYEVVYLSYNGAIEDIPSLLEIHDWTDAVLILEGFGECVETSEESFLAEITVLDSTSVLTTYTSSGISTVQAVTESYLQSRQGVEPISLSTSSFTVANARIVNVASTQIVSSLSIWEILLPLLLFLLIVTTSQTIVTAVTAEKAERTLEVLLASPIQRSHLILAKILAACVIALLHLFVYGTSFLLSLLLAVGGLACESLSITDSFDSLSITSQAITSLELGLSPLGIGVILLDLFLSMGITLLFSIILGAIIQDTKSTANASLPILLTAMIPYLFSMVGNVRGLSTIPKFLLYLIPYTHTFIATQSLRFHDTILVIGGLCYQLLFLLVSAVLALRLYQSDTLLLGMPTRRRH